MRDMAVLLTACAALTALATEAIKKMLGEKKYSVNLLAAAVSIVVAGLICTGYIIMTDTVLTPKVGVFAVSLIILSWLCAMCGYDKVTQMIKQLANTNANSGE